MAQELTFNITEDTRRLKRPTTVKDFQLSFGHADQGPTDVVIGDDGNIVQGRYGDSARQVFVNVVQGKNNEPVDITGYLPEFNGCIPDAEHIVIDNWDGVLVDPRHGRFRFDFPIQAFTVAGSYKQAYFRLVQNGTGKTLATLEFDMQVLKDFVYSNIVPQDYVTPYLDMINKLKDAYTNFVGKTQDSFDQAKKRLDDIMSTVEDKADDVEQRLKIDEQALTELSKKIDEKGLFTQAEADAFKQAIQKKLQDTIDSINKRGNRAYATVADMQKDSTLAEGTTVETRGYYAENDGGATTYQITANPVGFSIPLDNGLKAEQINKTGDNYYGDIKYSVDRDHRYHTTCYTITIPKNDYFGEMIMPEMNYHPEWISPNAWARQYHSTVTLNGDASIRIGPGETYMNGNVISGGKIIHQADTSKKYPDRMKSLAIMSDRSIREYQAGTSADQMLKDGAQVAFTVYYPLVKNGQKSGFANSDNADTDNLRAGGRVTEHYPALGIGEKSDGTWIVIGCDGRSIDEDGLMADELAQKFIEAGCVNAWRMDGGGSESINYRGAKLNRNYDDNGFTDRKLQWTFDIRKPTAADNSNSYATAAAGEQKLNLFRQIMYPVNTFLMSSFAILGNTRVDNADELENFLNEVAYRLNESQMPQGAHLTGILTIPFTNSAIAQALGYPNLSGDFQWDYTCTAGNHNTGMFTVKGVNDHQFQAFRQFTKLKEPHWSKWYAMNQTVSVAGPNGTGEVSNLVVHRYGNYVEFSCEIASNSNIWKSYITGLPLPPNDGPSMSVFGESQNRIGFFNLDKGGKLNLRADTNDSYNIHYTYLAKGPDYDIPY